ncbi:MAG: PucR family transcriptional regulator [Candidatus Lumbricidophila eiseniae]|uniref:PucR family transcriptional regulator n=1 Tax=Candidatus Lumbricidiphila eiseniae TaxID=1969409 RepID=A0A2A6FQT7_9MICO|nr:MAG: PucR family transcriptional regulator [Candidatus Lumbricidophila eiseniae]
MTTVPSKSETLAWLHRISGELATTTLKRLEDTVPWYRDMPPGRRSAVGLVAQAGITSFIEWYNDSTSTPWIASDVFGAAPRELLRSVSLLQTLQLIRVTVSVVEERIMQRETADLRDAILRYSRDVAFAAADVYARAAEARGLWDVRLEALVVDSILTGEADDELPSRIAALGWHGHGEVAVLVGTAIPQFDVDHLRRTARRLHADVLIGVQGSRLVVVIGKALPHGAETSEDPFSFSDIAHALADQFAPGHLVLGHVVPSLVDGTKSAKAALAGFAVVRSWRKAPRLVSADDLLPERALAGDPLARATLVHRVYRPLQARSSELLLTLWSYLESGRSLEATSRDLFVHPNTVRYRLKRVTELLGWDATIPRDAFVLQTALVVGATAIPDAQRTASHPRQKM